jgi:hypothetical protein
VSTAFRRFAALALLLAAGLAAAADPAEVLALARRNAAPDSAAIAALRRQVEEGLAQGGTRAGDWACLDLWLAAEWEERADLPARRAAFARAWPRSRHQEEADWLLARWRLRRGGAMPAARLLLELAGARDSALREEAGRLLEGLCDAVLADAELDSLGGESGPAGRAWLADWRERRRLRGRILLVAPLSGPDAALGTALRTGTEAALRQRRRAGGRELELETADCQSDALLLRELATRRGPAADALLLPGEGPYLAAAGGLDCGRPLLVSAAGGPLESLAPDLLQFGLDPVTQGRLLAGLARDSLGVEHVQSLAPVARPARRLVEALRAELEPHGVELGQEQWYFGGARDMAPQAENLRLFAEGREGAGAWVVLGSEREAPALLGLLAALPARGWVLGDAGLLAAVGERPPATLAGRLLVLTDWLPPALAGLARQAGAGGLEEGAAFARELEAREGRAPTAAEARAFESARLLALGWDEAARRQRGLGGVLAALEAPSLYGGALRMAGSRPHGALLLAWTEQGWRALGQRKA